MDDDDDVEFDVGIGCSWVRGVCMEDGEFVEDFLDPCSGIRINWMSAGIFFGMCLISFASFSFSFIISNDGGRCLIRGGVGVDMGVLVGT